MQGLEHVACPLSYLNLDGNSLGGETGALTLAAALAVNQSLTGISLAGWDHPKLVTLFWRGCGLGWGCNT